jgi:hypothetical protein
MADGVLRLFVWRCLTGVVAGETFQEIHQERTARITSHQLPDSNQDVAGGEIKCQESEDFLLLFNPFP